MSAPLYDTIGAGLHADLAAGRWAGRNRDLAGLDAAELGLRLLIA
jgi:hypothetical protein